MTEPTLSTDIDTATLSANVDNDQDDADFDFEDDDVEPPLGRHGSTHNPDIHIKWIADECPTLTDVALRLRSYADYVEDLERRGWQLSEPVDNSHGFVEWTREGTPPASDCLIVDCYEHPQARTQEG